MIAAASMTIEEAKSRLLLPDLARLLRIPGELPERDGVPCRCIWPDRHKHGDSRKSFNFYQGLTRFRCFGCGAGGDGPDLVGAWLGLPEREAVLHFIELAGGGDRVPMRSRVATDEVRRVAPAEPWGDAPEKREKRRAWPELRCGDAAMLGTVANLRGLSVETLKAAQRGGWLRFCELAGRRAWVLRSHCGRVAQARRLDGGLWRRGENEFKSWSLPGSCASVPLGLETLTPETRLVAIAEGGPDWLAVLQMVQEAGREDCAVVGFLGASVRIAEPLVEMLRGRRCRIFAHADEAGRRAAAEWAMQLQAADCVVDCFDFGAFGVKDGNDFVALPMSERDVEVMP